MYLYVKVEWTKITLFLNDTCYMYGDSKKHLPFMRDTWSFFAISITLYSASLTS